MGRFICSRGGVRPDGATLCDAFDTKSWSCTAAGGCQLQVEQVSDEMRQALEQVKVPSSLISVVERLKRRPDLFNMLSEDVFHPVQEALKIIDKTSPMNKYAGPPSGDGNVRTWDDVIRYWENFHAIEFDMAALSSLNVNIGILAARLNSDSKTAEAALTNAKAEKGIVIRQSAEKGMRNKMAESTVKDYVTIDPQITEMEEIQLKAQAAASIFYNLHHSIEEHINVLKKRLGTFNPEYRGAGREGG